jgi:histidinol-phosphate aminotransferase
MQRFLLTLFGDTSTVAEIRTIVPAGGATMQEEPVSAERPLTRRTFVRSWGGRVGGPFALVVARGQEAQAGGTAFAGPGPGPGASAVHINSNENPVGPGPSAVAALRDHLGEAGRYPHNSEPSERLLIQTLTEVFTLAPENFVLGAGSGELLRNAVRAFCSPERPFVTASPSFEPPAMFAEMTGVPVRSVPVDGNLRLDLAAMGEAAQGAGLVFVCNPNNPTGTLHSADAIAGFVERVRARSPDTVVLLDEAYHDYVTDSAYATAIPLAVAQEKLLVTRTMSKAHGMAGLRVGYAVGRPDTLKALARYRMTFDVNVLGIAAAIASLRDPDYVARERTRNTEVRAFTVSALAKMGCPGCDSQANFLFVDVGRSAKGFREACGKQGILVGRDFPPLEKSHARISLGTMEEMRRAVDVFREVLSPAPARAASLRTAGLGPQTSGRWL